jgi:hypothetical protein
LRNEATRFFRQRRLEREVEARQCFDSGEARHLQCRLDPASLADGNLLGKRGLDCLGCGELTTLELLDDVVDS